MNNVRSVIMSDVVTALYRRLNTKDVVALYNAMNALLELLRTVGGQKSIGNIIPDP